MFGEPKGIFQNMSMWHAYMFSYAYPLFVTLLALTDAMTRDDLLTGYFREDACWLGDGYILTFKMPLAFSLFLNTYLLITTWRAGWKVCNTLLQLNALHLSLLKELERLGWRLLLSLVVTIHWFFDYFSSFGEVWQWCFIIWNFLASLCIFCETLNLTSQQSEIRTTQTTDSHVQNEREEEPDDPPVDLEGGNVPICRPIS